MPSHHSYRFPVHLPIILLAMITISLPAGCDGTGGNSNQDRIVLSSAFDFSSATTRGYSFSEARYVEFPSSTESAPDIIIENFKQIEKPPQPGFTSPSNNHGFALVGTFESLAESEEFYQNYKEFDASLPMSPTTDTVRQYQVYVLRTVLEQYVRIHVRSITNVEDMSGSHVDVTIDYYYQEDGSSLFP